MIRTRRVFYLNSAKRLAGEDASNCLMEVKIPTNETFTHVCVVDASIPKSYHMVQAGFNTFTVRERSAAHHRPDARMLLSNIIRNGSEKATEHGSTCRMDVQHDAARAKRTQYGQMDLHRRRQQLATIIRNNHERVRTPRVQRHVNKHILGQHLDFHQCDETAERRRAVHPLRYCYRRC